MFRFAHIEYLYALLLIPFFVLLFIWLKQRKKKSLSAFASKEMLNILMPDYSPLRSNFKFILYTFGFIFTLIAIASPQFGSKLEEVKRSGIDLIIALDVSNSMKAQDIAPNRLTSSKRAISKLIDKLQGDRLGIVVFGGESYVQLPITNDYAAAKLFVENIDTDLIPTQGTAIGNAIETAISCFYKESKNKKVIVVITDGENHEDDAVKIAREAVDKGIIVHTIGMGSAEGAPIPVAGGNFKKDNEGNVVITKLNEAMLTEIAAAGKGIYVRSTNSQIGLNVIYDEINKLEKTEYESKSFTDYEDRFQYFLFPALLLLVLEILLSDRKSRLIEKIIKKIQ